MKFCYKRHIGASKNLVSVVLLLTASAYGVAFVAQTTFGGTGDETGKGIYANSAGMYFTGYTAAQTQAVVGQFSQSLDASPVWSKRERSNRIYTKKH